MNYNRLYTILILALAATSCIQDPESPMNLPEVPVISVDETAVTRVSMVVNGTFGKDMTDITQYGVEISETLFDAGGTYKTLVPQEMGADGYSLGVTGLTLNQTYFLRAYISNGHSKMYSSTVTQKTPESSVASLSDVTILDDYYLVATIEDDGGRNLEDVGFVWGEVNDRKAIRREKRYPGTLGADGKTLTLPLSGVGKGTYYVLAYAEDDKDGTGFSRIPFELVLKDDVPPEKPDEPVPFAAVDMGLSVKWANMNLGATSPEEVGDYFAWGETETKDKYSLQTYKWYNSGNNNLTKYNVNSSLGPVDNKTVLEATDDVAHEKLGEKWRMPTSDEVDELISTRNDASYRWEWKSLNDHDGWLVTYLVSNSSIFLPVAGLRDDIALYNVGSSGFYWSSSLFSDNSYCANYLYFDSVNVDGGSGTGLRNYGQSVRPVYGDAAPSSISASKYLTFTSEGTTTIYLGYNQAYAPELYYSTDAKNWTKWNYGQLTFSSDSPLYIFGDNPYGFSFGPSNFHSFYAEGDKFSVSGSVMSLINGTDDVTTIPNTYCFYQLFGNCDLLTSAPSLPATNLTEHCYEAMFSYCSGLTSAPEVLPAVSLAPFCYGHMFYGCTSLTTAPELPAPSLVNYSYYHMFCGCSSLSYIKCLAKDISATYSLLNWTTDVAPTGTFVKASEMNNWQRGTAGVPNGWTLLNDGEEPLTVSKYLTFISEGTTTVSLKSEGGNTPVLYYSYDRETWILWDYSELSFADNLPLYLCGDNPNKFDSDFYTYSYFSASGDHFAVSGSIMSLLDMNEDMTVIPQSEGCFHNLFLSCTLLTEGPTLPATTLSYYCYRGMFSGCTSLKESPVLPATILDVGCYCEMFTDCTSLTVAPSLPATKLSGGCYEGMFLGCTRLTTAPELPATELAQSCYSGMFSGCSGLTTPPSLPAIIMKYHCYSGMFRDCTSLTVAPILPATSLDIYCYQGMFYGCTQLSDAPALPATTMYDGCYQSMFEACSGLKSSPSLPATTMVENCYRSMFSYCTSLTSVPSVLPATTLAPNCYQMMFRGCSSLISAPEILATTLAKECCYYMFWGCTSLTTAPSILPATTLATDCYCGMFRDCSNITTAPQLPATTLAYECYADMFNGCSSLISAPELPATTLDTFCYESMFSNCTSLITAPNLPATTLKGKCYANMFSGCTSLNTAPELPAIDLAYGCYYYMFYNCAKLTTAPALPATVLANECYLCMFCNCASLAAAPDLPADTLMDSCYQQMFMGCSNLKYIKCLAVDISAYRCTDYWTSGVNTSGQFIKSAQMNDWTTGNYGIPEGWTVEDAQ